VVTRLFLLCLISLTVLLALSGIAAWAQTGEGTGWSVPVEVPSATGEVRWALSLATDDAGRLHMVWTEETMPGYFRGSIFYALWDGQAWTAPVRLSTYSSELAQWPAIAVDARGIIHVVYVGNERLYYTYTYAGGTPWVPASWSIPRDIGGMEPVSWPDLAIDSDDQLHVVWSAGTVADIFYSSSTDGGKEWSSPVQLSDSSEVEDLRPQLAIGRPGEIHLVWTERALKEGTILGSLYRRSLDGGNSWSPASNIREGQANWMGIAADVRGNVHVICHYTGEERQQNGQVHQWSSDGGSSWSAPVVLPKPKTTGWSGSDAIPGMVVDSAGHLHVVIGEGSRVYYLRWDGQQWAPGPPLDLSVADTVSMQPQIALGEGNRLHVVWYWDQVNGNGLYDFYHTTTRFSIPAIPTRAYPPPTPTLSPTPWFGELPTPPPTNTPQPASTETATVTPLPTASPSLTSQVPTVTPFAQGRVTPGSGFPLAVAVIPVAALIALLVLTRPLWSGEMSWPRFWRRLRRRLW